ncbi:MAG: ATP-binding protein [Treponema sp.]|uniref:ATP-binding protein n=1 Tax=Treponema sp. TaxID=166 RepID=UPI003FA2A176
MERIRKLPIGVQNFEVLQNGNFIYVDKTEFIWKLVTESRVHFLSRPRRFGKSLFLSTLKAYFLGQKELFKGLAIEKLEETQAEMRDIWQEYPVLYLDFNAAQYRSVRDLEIIINDHLCQWEKIYGMEPSEEDFSRRFAGLIRRACEQTGKQVVVLVDEYDKPLLETMYDAPEVNETYRKILKGFYGVIKSSDEYLRFAFLTGVTKFSKVSIFSDLNNLRDISLEEDYAGICGITETELKTCFQPEIQVLGDRQGLSYDKTLARLKQRYDGYLFHPDKEGVYNPFSLLNVFVKRELGSYWFSSGTPTFLVDYLKTAYYHIPDLDGNVLLNEAGLEIYHADSINPLPILFQAGYLTIKDYDREYKLYRLGFPNDEVRYGFLYNLMPAYTAITSDKTGVSVMDFTKAVKQGDVDGFMEKLKGIISGIPYDSVTEKNLVLREQNYQAAVYLVFALMNEFIRTEVHCATGRIDCTVETPDKIYLFEFKLTSNGSAEDALKQIKDKQYADRYTGSGKRVIAIGASFDEEKRTLKEWVTEG